MRTLPDPGAIVTQLTGWTVPAQICYTWHATAQDSSGRTLTCVHLPDSDHLMYWEHGGPSDS